MSQGNLQMPLTVHLADEVVLALQERRILVTQDRLLGELRELMATMPEKGEFLLNDYGNGSSVSVNLPTPEIPSGRGVPLYDVYSAVQTKGQPDTVERFCVGQDRVQGEVERRMASVCSGLNGQVSTLLSHLPVLRERTDAQFSVPDGTVRIAVSLHDRVLRDFYAKLEDALSMGPLIRGQVWRSVR